VLPDANAQAQQTRLLARGAGRCGVVGVGGDREPSDALPVTPTLPTAPADLKTGEFRCAVQIVRTFDKQFAPAANGEKGVLEAYLRGIHFAERFIYIENQYFNNDTITQALIDAMVAKPALEVLLLLNAGPDMPLYISWQQKAIQKMIDALGGAAAATPRLGVFSLWTHEPALTPQSHASLVDNYLHTKSALIDNRWATVGSANLDGVSLDYLQYFPSLLDGDVRNTETNVVVFDETAPSVPAVDALRRRLWSEHLGMVEADLADAPGKKWLPIWRQQADAKKAALQANLDTVVASRVLEWASTSFDKRVCICGRHDPHATARAYLQDLLKPKEIPASVVADGGPGSYVFTYGAFPNTDVPRARPAVAAVPAPVAISDEEEAT
jgi:phosphatidylserine/phosphatidylglycerophosphate/cardiolipin synthase-like enzyme